MSLIGQEADVSLTFELDGAESFSVFIDTRIDKPKKINKFVRKKAAKFGIKIKKQFEVVVDKYKTNDSVFVTVVFSFEKPLADTEEAYENAEKFMEFLESDPKTKRFVVFGG